MHAHWALRVLSAPAQPWTRGWPCPGLCNSGAQTGVLVRQGCKDRTVPWRGRLRAARDVCASEGRWHRCCRRPRPGVKPAGSAKAEEPPRAREGRLAVGKGPREGGRSRVGRWWWRGTGAQGPSATPARGSVLSNAEPGHTRGLGRIHPLPTRAPQPRGAPGGRGRDAVRGARARRGRGMRPARAGPPGARVRAVAPPRRAAVPGQVLPPLGLGFPHAGGLPGAETAAAHRQGPTGRPARRGSGFRSGRARPARGSADALVPGRARERGGAGRGGNAPPPAREGQSEGAAGPVWGDALGAGPAGAEESPRAGGGRRAAGGGGGDGSRSRDSDAARRLPRQSRSGSAARRSRRLPVRARGRGGGRAACEGDRSGGHGAAPSVLSGGRGRRGPAPR